MSNEIATSDLSEFGYTELKEVAVLLDAYKSDKQHKNVDLWEEVKPMFNKDSGNVFLTDENFNVAMMNGDTLEKWFYCGNCGFEGFEEEFNTYEDDDDHKVKCPECDEDQ